MSSAASSLASAGLLAIIRAAGTEAETAVLLEAARALHAGGVMCMEITLNTPGALRSIEAIRATLPDMCCGAGTVLSAEDARAAREAGAQFIVTPTLDLATVAFCKQHALAVSPGCASPTEAMQAARAGADFVKIFPANRFGLAHMRAMLQALPQLRLVPTGGVRAGNVHEYLEAGCAAVAAGSTLVTHEILRDRDWLTLERAAREFVNAIAAWRQGRIP